MSSRGSHVVVHVPKAEGWVKTPNAFIRDRGIAPGPFRVILWLASQSEHRAIYKSVCAKELGIARTTLNDWLAEAEKTPYLWLESTGQRDHQGNPTHVFHINLDPELAIPRSQPLHGRVADLDAKKITKEDHSLPRQVPAKPAALPMPLADEWEPSHQHQAMAERDGWDLELLVEEFRCTEAAVYELRADWDKAFTRFCQDFTAGHTYWATA